MKRFYKNSSDFKTFVMALFCALPFFFVVSFGCSKSGKDDRNAKDKTAADAKFLED
jgi:hypothetical protein